MLPLSGVSRKYPVGVEVLTNQVVYIVSWCSPGARVFMFLMLGTHPPLPTLEHRSFVWDKIRDKEDCCFIILLVAIKCVFHEMFLGLGGRLCCPLLKILQGGALLVTSAERLRKDKRFI